MSLKNTDFINDYQNTDFKENIVATNFPYEYFPFYLTKNNVVNNKDIIRLIDDVFTYQKPDDYTYVKKAYRDFLLNLFNKNALMQLRNNSLRCLRGYIINSLNEVLLVLTTNHENVFRTDGYLITKNLKLYINNDFVFNENYTTIYKKIYKDYILLLQKNGVDVIYTNLERINQEVFGNNFQLNFNSIEDINNHLKEQSEINFIL